MIDLNLLCEFLFECRRALLITLEHLNYSVLFSFYWLTLLWDSWLFWSTGGDRLQSGERVSEFFCYFLESEDVSINELESLVVKVKVFPVLSQFIIHVVV